MDNKIYIIDESGMRVDARILAKFKLENDNKYIVYTLDEINAEGMIKIYVTGLVEDNGAYSYKEITTDEEWTNLKGILKGLAKSELEAFPESIKLDNKLVGEEISVRKPKKLLVSKKFADVIGSKYSEVSETPVIEPAPVPEIEIPVVETTVEPVVEKEPEIEKTIKIPTFEELQARNKTIQSVMETAQSSEPKVEEPVIESNKPVYESRVQKVDYQSEFKKTVEPVLMDVYAKQQKQIEELEEELSKTKFDLFEKQKEALSLNNEKEEMKKKNAALEDQLTDVQKKMDGILNVLQDK